MNRSETVCRFFLNGYCRYDTHCRFAHVLPYQEYDDATPNEGTETETRNWIDAPEFVPRCLSVIDEVESNDENEQAISPTEANHYSATYAQILMKDKSTQYIDVANDVLCPYLNMMVQPGECESACRYGDNYGLLCTMCGQYCLHPTDENERKKHEKECLELMEKDMEHSFAVARSKDKTCGICFEVVIEKAKRGEHRFGILPNCNHVFCLSCIRTWRKATSFDNSITRACPECRVESNYVCPSLYWVDTKEEKDALLNQYKDALNGRHCKYFRRGEGICPFGNKCFYKHASLTGELVDVGKPQKRRCIDQELQSSIMEDIVLWSFLRVRENYEDDTLSEASAQTN